MTVKSMWGDLGSLEEIRTPMKYLRDQATALSELTENVLVGEVIYGWGTGGEFTIELRIVVPNLNSYRYSILEVKHPIEIYPLRMYDYATQTRYECKNEEEFLADLESILSSPAVRKVITTLISQSRA